MAIHGVFVGLCTIDIIHRAPRVPGANEKIVAKEQLCVAGGPATNAAVAFSHLGGAASLVTALGVHPLTRIVRDDLDANSVALRDLIPQANVPPTVSSIIVTDSTGDRAVVSTNATQMSVSGELLRREWLEAQIILVDGHHLAVALSAARWARSRGIPVVLDGGSWKPGMEALLAFCDVVICSERFRPPGAGESPEEVLAWLTSIGVRDAAVTRGSRPICFRSEKEGAGELPVAHVRAADTLGAGDILHGAFCARAARPGATFLESLEHAARTASESCRTFGTRAWMAARRPS